MHRLFVALRPPEAVRDTLIDAMEGLEGARWQDEAQLHLTLRFIGEVERPMAEDIANALAGIRAPAVALEARGVGHFSHKGRPTSLWARVALTPELEGLRQKVELACERAGVGRETRRFTPHVTLARLNRSVSGWAEWLSRHGSIAGGKWTADSFTLFESHLGQAGAHYEPVAQYRLGS